MNMFRTEPFSDFSIPAVRNELQAALDNFERDLLHGPKTFGSIINGKERRSEKTLLSTDPSDDRIAIAQVYLSTIKDTEDAIASAKLAQACWEMTDVKTRANCLRKAATLMRERRHYLNALIIREAAKPWKEADGDVAEAIDFCDYYAEEMERLAPPKLTMEVPGEENHYFYQARGVAAVIAPWNFPLAIACGMTTAALVSGNTVIFKPAEQTPLIGYELVKILHEAGVPTDCVHFLPGIGEEVGRALVKHPDISLICFTGSKAVGLEIIKEAAVTPPGQQHVKKVIAEMGGKNAIIVDESADPDDTIKGVIDSAFGFAGQKCSACSRLIIVGGQYDTLVSRLKEAVASIIIGAPKDPATFVPPVIDREAQARISKSIAKAKETATLLFEGKIPSEHGSYVPITIFKDVSPTHSLFTDEFFAPVLAITKVNSFDEALKLANSSEYALTGGVFSRNPESLEKARKGFKVGNLYLNRKCTGALVKRQPFGGFKMSGIGSKAGGPDYLLQFLEPRVVTENTIRRGMVS